MVQGNFLHSVRVIVGFVALALSVLATGRMTYVLAAGKSWPSLLVIASALFTLWLVAWTDRGRIASFLYLITLGILLGTLFKGMLDHPIMLGVVAAYAALTIIGGLSIRWIRGDARASRA